MPPKDNTNLKPEYFYINAGDKDNPIPVKRGDFNDDKFLLEVNVGDICIYGFHDTNKSCSIVEIVRILDDERGVAEIKFHNVFVDDSGNGYFNYLLKTGGTMNASFKYLKTIIPGGALQT